VAGHGRRKLGDQIRGYDFITIGHLQVWSVLQLTTRLIVAGRVEGYQFLLEFRKVHLKRFRGVFRPIGVSNGPVVQCGGVDGSSRAGE